MTKYELKEELKNMGSRPFAGLYLRWQERKDIDKITDYLEIVRMAFPDAHSVQDDHNRILGG